MLDFLIDNIFVMFGGRIFQQTVGIPMGTNCAPLLADLFLYSYEDYFIQSLPQGKEKKSSQSLGFTFCYIDDILLLNNSKFYQKRLSCEVCLQVQAPVDLCDFVFDYYIITLKHRQLDVYQPSANQSLNIICETSLTRLRHGHIHV